MTCVLCTYAPDDRLVLATPLWRVVHDPDPVVVTGKLYVTLQRHAESLDELTDAESGAVGALLARVVAALKAELGVDRVHVGTYGEQLRHLHFHVTPRPSRAPRGNAPFALWQGWRRALVRLRVAKPIPANHTATLVRALAAALAR